MSADGLRLLQNGETTYLQSSPDDAVNLVLDQIPPGQAYDNALLMIAYQWANQNVVEAATWVNGFPNGSLRDNAMRELQLVIDRQQVMANQ